MLVIQVMRTQHNAEGPYKESSPVVVDESLDVRQFMVQDYVGDGIENSETTYDLRSFIVHLGGRNADTGKMLLRFLSRNTLVDVLMVSHL